MDREFSGKMSKEALWVKMQSLCGSLRLFQIPAAAGQWRHAMLRDRRVKDSSFLNGSHKKAWDKVSCLERTVEAFLKEEDTEDFGAELISYLSDTEKEKCRPFLSLLEGKRLG